MMRLLRRRLTTSAAAVHAEITARFDAHARPPAKFLRRVQLDASEPGDAALALDAHKRYIGAQMQISKSAVDGLVDACVRTKEWDTLMEALGQSKRNQLFFSGPGPLKRALTGLGDDGEFERIEVLHGWLPRMAVPVTAQMNFDVVRTLANAGELEAAARALARATAAGTPLKPAAFAVLGSAQLEAGRAAEALTTAHAAHAAKLSPNAGLLAVAVRACLAHNDATASGGAEAEGAAEGEAEGEAKGEGESGEGAAAEGEAEAARLPFEPLPLLESMAAAAEPQARAAALSKLEAAGVTVDALPGALAKAMRA